MHLCFGNFSDLKMKTLYSIGGITHLWQARVFEVEVEVEFEIEVDPSTGS